MATIDELKAFAAEEAERAARKAQLEAEGNARLAEIFAGETGQAFLAELKEAQTMFVDGSELHVFLTRQIDVFRRIPQQMELRIRRGELLQKRHELTKAKSAAGGGPVRRQNGQKKG